MTHFACRIAVYTVTTARRKARVRPWESAEDSEVERTAAPGESPAAVVHAARRRRVLRELCTTLPEPQAQALLLHCVLGHSLEEVASIAGVPVNTVRSRMRLAKEALRARLEQDPSLKGAMEEFE